MTVGELVARLRNFDQEAHVGLSVRRPGMVAIDRVSMVVGSYVEAEDGAEMLMVAHEHKGSKRLVCLQDAELDQEEGFWS